MSVEMETPKSQKRKAKTAMVGTSERPGSIAPPPGLLYDSSQASEAMDLDGQSAAGKDGLGHADENG